MSDYRKYLTRTGDSTVSGETDMDHLTDESPADELEELLLHMMLYGWGYYTPE